MAILNTKPFNKSLSHVKSVWIDGEEFFPEFQESDPIAYPIATNALDIASNFGATALQPSWAATGTVAHATDAGRIAVAGDADYWQTVEHGTATVWRVSDDTTRMYIVSASGDFNGPATGTELSYTSEYGMWWGVNELNGFMIEATSMLFTLVSDYNFSSADGVWVSTPSTPSTMPATLYAVANDPIAAVGSCVIDYVPVTNSYPLAITDDIAAHAADGSAHPDIREAISSIPTPFTPRSFTFLGTNLTSTTIYLTNYCSYVFMNSQVDLTTNPNTQFVWPTLAANEAYDITFHFFWNGGGTPTSVWAYDAYGLFPDADLAGLAVYVANPYGGGAEITFGRCSVHVYGVATQGYYVFDIKKYSWLD